MMDNNKPQASNYPKVIVGAALVSQHGRLLLIQSSGKFGKQWIIPGGKLDFGERLVDGLHREVREETGLQISRLEFLGTRESIEGERHFVCFEYLCFVDGEPTPTLNYEATAHRWVDKASLNSLAVMPLTAQLINEHLLPRGIPAPMTLQMR